MYYSHSQSSHVKEFTHKPLTRRWLAFLLTVCMLIPMTAPFVSTAENAIQSQPNEEDALSGVLREELAPEIEAELSPITNSVLLRSETLSNENLPFAMSLDAAQEKGFVGRLKAVENDLHSIVLADNDGELTLYYYKDPVKYIDELGQVKDKSDKLYAYKDGSFATIASDIRTDLPKNLADGIILRKDDYRLQLSPDCSTNAIGTLSNDQRVVTYALNDQTSYQYSLTAMGFKEDIVVSEYTGQTEYTFTLQTHGLTPVNDNGTYVLVDNDGIQRATLGDVIIFTADERNNTFGELLVNELVAGSEYQLTVKVDADWLADPKTAYPITIDPALSYVDGDFTIEDMVVGTSTTYSKTSSSLYVGRGSSGAKIRTLMRFPNLNITGYNVTSATVSIRDLLCESEAQTVQCYEYIGTEWASSGTFAWNDMGSSPIGIFLDEKTISYANGSALATNKHRYEFNITALAQKWANDTASPTKGLMFKATDTYETSGTKTFKTFASVDRGSNSPWMVVNYASSTPTIILSTSSMSLNIGETATIGVTTTPTNFAVTLVSSDPSIASVNSTTGLVTAISSGTVTITASADGATPKICVITVASTIQDIQMQSTHVICASNGGTAWVDIKVSPTTASARPVTWTSSNPAVATVTNDPNSPQDALMTGVSSGCAILTATGDGHSVSIIVYVENNPTFENGIPYLMCIKNSCTLWKRSENALCHAQYNTETNEESFHWYLTCVDNTSSSQYFVITCGYRKGQYLYITDTGELGFSTLSTTNLLSAPDKYKWYLDSTYGFKNKATNQFICQSSGNTIILSTAHNTRGVVRCEKANLFVALTKLNVTNLTIPAAKSSWLTLQATDDENHAATWCDYSDFSYSYSDTSIANATSSGRVEVFNNVGSTVVTITHKLTGVSTTCTVRCVPNIALEKEDSATQVGELFFTIASKSDNRYLQASNTIANTVLATSSNTPIEDGRYIWRLKQNAYGYYQFISVSTYRTVNGLYSEAGLSASPSVSTAAVSAPEYKQQWVIEEASGGYYIINHYYNQYLTRSGSSLILSNTATSNSIWKISGIPADQFNAFFEGSISDAALDPMGDMLHVWIDVADSITSYYPHISKDDVREWASEWNGVYDNISIHVNPQKPTYINPLYVIHIDTSNFDPSLPKSLACTTVNNLGMPESPSEVLEQEEYDDDDWSSATIWMNTAYVDNDPASNEILSADLFRITLIHEIGHALKLVHPDVDPASSFTNIRNSIMCSSGRLNDSPNNITDFDRMMLLAKWKYNNPIIGIMQSMSISEEVTTIAPEEELTTTSNDTPNTNQLTNLEE